MNGIFRFSNEINEVELDWGTQKWFSQPSSTGAEMLVLVEVDILPGFGHDFHKHPRQEEAIYVLDGQIEQWLEIEKRILSSGDSAFIPSDKVHASFNVSDKPVKVLAILGPCIGEEGYELVDVSDQSPWKNIR